MARAAPGPLGHAWPRNRLTMLACAGLTAWALTAGEADAQHHHLRGRARFFSRRNRLRKPSHTSITSSMSAVISRPLR